MITLDYSKLVEQYLTPVYRKSRMMALCRCMVWPLRERYAATNVALAYRRPICPDLGGEESVAGAYRYDITRSSWGYQTLGIEKLLNLYFIGNFNQSAAKGTPGFSIYIEEIDIQPETVPLFTRSEGQIPAYLPLRSEPTTPPYLYTRAELNSAQFVVNIPAWAASVAPANKVDDLLSQFIVAGASYSITYF